MKQGPINVKIKCTAELKPLKELGDKLSSSVLNLRSSLVTTQEAITNTMEAFKLFSSELDKVSNLSIPVPVEVVDTKKPTIFQRLSKRFLNFCSKYCKFFKMRKTAEK